jgi:predicted O-methyltransferase YrrM
MTLQELEVLANIPGNRMDDRPPWLLSMPSANQPDSYYYRFLRELTRTMKPRLSVEIGTYVGTGAAHLADGYPEGAVVTIDCNEGARGMADALNIVNLCAVHGDSAQSVKMFRATHPIDILFIDGAHTFNNCYGEYVMYRPFVRDGGVILFDDIEYGRQMEVAWKYIPDPKIALKRLHYTGFGAAIKTPGVVVSTWNEVATAAAAEFSK